MKKLYKVLNKDLKSPFKKFQFELGKIYHCKTFNNNPKIDCTDGFYATDIEGLPYSFNIHCVVYECEVWGNEVEINQYKRRYEYMKIINEISHNIIKLKAKEIENKLGYKISEVLFPFNPLTQKIKPTKKDINLIKKWASVWASVLDSVGVSVGVSVRDSVWVSVGVSVRDSVWASVWDSVRDSVWASVRDSVRDSVRASVWDSVWAYISSLFPNIQQWKYIEHSKGINPFQSGIDLWYRGLVPSYDGKVLRLHSGPKADIVWEEKGD